MTGVKNAMAEREAEDGDRLTELGKTASTGVKSSTIQYKLEIILHYKTLVRMWEIHVFVFQIKEHEIVLTNKRSIRWVMICSEIIGFAPGLS